MRAIPYLMITLFAALQAIVAVFWMKAGAARRFTNVFEGIYGATPPWSALAFSIGWYWLILPIITIVWLLCAWRWKAFRCFPWAAMLLSLLVLLSMVYAMYPLHIIFA